MHDEEAANGTENVYGAEDKLRNIAVADTGCLESGGTFTAKLSVESRCEAGTEKLTVVEEVVSAGKLRRSLDEDPEQSPVEHSISRENVVPTNIGRALLFV